MTTTSVPRAVCDRCRRPTPVCVCRLLPDLAPSTRVLIVQHPKERRVAIGTARMAARCLRGARVVVGTEVDDHPAIVAALEDGSRRPVLLWPGPDATDLATSPPVGPITLVVVDGTWSLAKKLIRLNPSIAALPRYGIAPAGPSEYRIRREPRAECLSTIEAISRALGVLEGDPAPYAAMLEPFRAMVDAQLAHQGGGGSPRDRSRLRRRVRPVWAPPVPLRDPSRVVVVAVESNAWPIHATESHPDEIVHVVAVRGDDSERVEIVVRPSHPLAPSVASHTGLDADSLLAAAPRETLAPALAAFLRDGDVLATWGPYAPRMLADAGLVDGRATFDLRRVLADATHQSPGTMEECVARLGAVPRTFGAGRAGRRVGLVMAVYEAISSGRAARGRTMGNVKADA